LYAQANGVDRGYSSDLRTAAMVKATGGQPMERVAEELKKHYLKAFDALADLIEYCPDELWPAKHGGYLFAQQILHVLTCSIYYLRYEGDTEELNEPVIKRREALQPSLGNVATEVLSKQELEHMFNLFRPKLERYFDQLDARMQEESSASEGDTNLSVVLMEIRHVAYHAGHLDCIIREKGLKSPGWGYMS
jgi:predicted transcriptional regulator